MKTAAALAIGDELLSGRTRDANVHHLAGWLTERGVALKEARMVADDQDAIVEAVRALSARHDYVFTSGGIGPTHDDITAEAIAKAFNQPFTEHPEIIRLMEAWYSAQGEELTPARRRMAMTPAGAELIRNKETGAPGFAVENVFILAGVPSIFRSMLDALEDRVARGPALTSLAITARGVPESRLAEQLAAVQDALNGVQIGSYPIDDAEKGVTVVARSERADLAERAIEAVEAAMRAAGVEPVRGDRKG
ncbi:MAG: molybdopterin-binding protein [Pseudomonadota bacterium]